MRDIKQLLEFLLEKLEENGSLRFGLCFEVLTSYNETKNITHDEKILISNYITKNIPVYSEDEEYGWRPGLLKPRIEWLKKEIEKL